MSQQASDADKVLTRIREQVERLEKVHSEREQVEKWRTFQGLFLTAKRQNIVSK